MLRNGYSVSDFNMQVGALKNINRHDDGTTRFIYFYQFFPLSHNAIPLLLLWVVVPHNSYQYFTHILHIQVQWSHCMFLCHIRSVHWICLIISYVFLVLFFSLVVATAGGDVVFVAVVDHSWVCECNNSTTIRHRRWYKQRKATILVTKAILPR